VTSVTVQKCLIFESLAVSLPGLVTSPKALYPPHVASRSILDLSTPWRENGSSILPEPSRGAEMSTLGGATPIRSYIRAPLGNRLLRGHLRP
jgi:hypothetical protein